MSKALIDIDNTICNTSEFYGKMAVEYDRNVLHKNNPINFDKVVPRSDAWSKEELAYFIDNYFNKEAINIPVKDTAAFYIKKIKELGYEIVIITNRGIKDDDHSDLIIPEYLEKNDVTYDSIITKTDDKYIYLNEDDYLIDDTVSVCENALLKSNGNVIMMASDRTKEYNNDKLFKARNWQEVYEHILVRKRSI